ncbi:early nodulin-like protein 2 [Morus notabilis]|uniref:early nodulin-like protein 2 n=1 Tax=Morus notabilis TaxID=981085 RepID=UPI000CED785E|nr:early nodulin-like protein 2 [Morus notabilis]
MAFQRFLLLVSVLLLFSCFLSSSQAYKFNVGGSDGWVLNPSENFNHWAERNRFQANDTLYFKYKKGTDSVLVVNKDDYNNCNTKNPIQKLEDGDSVFKFDRSGPFFFISGKYGSCQKGQKLIVVVLAVRPKPNTPPAAGAHPPVTAPVPSSSPSSSPSPSSSNTPTTAPVQAPTGSSAITPSPLSNSPATSPASAPSGLSPSPSWNSPTGSPVQAPSAFLPSPSSNSPTGSPVQAPSAFLPSPSSNSPTGSPGQAPLPFSPSPYSNSPTGSPGQAPLPFSPSPSTNSPASSPVSSPPAPSPTTETPPPASSPSPTTPSTAQPTPTPTGGESSPAPGSENQNSTKSNAVTLAPLVMSSSLAVLVPLVLFWTIIF